MKQFKTRRKLDDAKQRLNELGYKQTKRSQKVHDEGSDYLLFSNKKLSSKLFLNTFNFKFTLEINEIKCNEWSSNCDNESWYTDILNALYV